MVVRNYVYILNKENFIILYVLVLFLQNFARLRTCPSRRNRFPGRVPGGGDGDLTTHPAGRHSDMGNANNQVHGLRFRLVTRCLLASCPVPAGAPRTARSGRRVPARQRPPEQEPGRSPEILPPALGL